MVEDIDQGLSHLLVLDLVNPEDQNNGLLRAVMNGNKELTEKLLQRSANVNSSGDAANVLLVRDPLQRTAVVLAVINKKDLF